MTDNFSRRSFISTLGGGLGSVALADLLAGKALSAESPHRAGPHFAPKAKHIILLFMTGGPSQVDLLDPKPALKKYEGQRPAGVNLRTERKTGGLLPSMFKFKKHGKSGIEVSELLPNLASTIDDLCVIRSVYSFNPNHEPGRNLFFSGIMTSMRPTIGAWVSYGLGTENQNLPAFVVLSPTANSLWTSSGFLPAEYQGTLFNNTESDPEKMIRFLRNKDLDVTAQRAQLDAIQTLNRAHAENFGADDFLEGRIKSMETAYRMQFTASDVFDIRKEPESVRAEYGTTPYANGCLMARRLVESGVRYVQVHHGPGQQWDDHENLEKGLRQRCPDMDRASAALIRDLKRRGLLDETLVIWGGEFGRTPVSEKGNGRDHNPYGFTMWLAGGGVKAGMVYGATDEFGFKAVEKQVSIHDLHATVLHLLGLDHEKLTYRYAGRDFRLTDVYGNVVRDVIA
jgi:Protein of unknown function (DUF1501)